jgi:hypothetical protein
MKSCDGSFCQNETEKPKLMKVKLKLKLAKLNIICVCSLHGTKVKVYCIALAVMSVFGLNLCRQGEYQSVTLMD